MLDGLAARRQRQLSPASQAPRIAREIARAAARTAGTSEDGFDYAAWTTSDRAAATCPSSPNTGAATDTASEVT